MDCEKPNWRPNRKTKHIYAREVALSVMPSTLSVASLDSSSVVARGESFAHGVEYSLNKSRRWELSEREFVPDSETAKIVVARAPHTEPLVTSSIFAFYDRSANAPVDEQTEDATSQQQTPTKTNRKDRKHFRAPKAAKSNTRLANSHQAAVYEAGTADIHVAILETPEKSKLHKVRAPKDMRLQTRYTDHQARTHKNQELARLNF